MRIRIRAILTQGAVVVAMLAGPAGSNAAVAPAAAPGWSAPAQVDLSGGGLTAVSCPALDFCVGTDFDGRALTYNGASWSKPTAIDTHRAFDSVSCTSASFCVAVDDDANVFTYNGSVWSAPQAIDTAGNQLEGVSCVSQSFCMAVDWNDPAAAPASESGNAISFNGSTWSAPNMIDSQAVLSDVSCVSSSFCMAVDDDGDTFTYNGSAWSAPTNVDGSNTLSSVSCVSASFCAAVDQNGNAFIYDGAAWSSATIVDRIGLPSAISCAAVSFCVAVDDNGNAFTYNGSTWSTPRTIDPHRSGVSGVSCPTTTNCVALDTFGDAIAYQTGSTSSELSAIGVLVSRNHNNSRAKQNVPAYSACTASVVRSSSGDVVLTAGHCAGLAGHLSHQIAFAPGFRGRLCGLHVKRIGSRKVSFVGSTRVTPTMSPATYLKCGSTPHGIWTTSGLPITSYRGGGASSREKDWAFLTMAQRHGAAIASVVGGGVPISFGQPQTQTWAAYGLARPAALHACIAAARRTAFGPKLGCASGHDLLLTASGGGPWIDAGGAVGAVSSGVSGHALYGALLDQAAQRGYNRAASR